MDLLRFGGAALAACTIASASPAQQLEDWMVEDLRWRSVGPAAMGGRIIDLEVHPSQPWTVYVASATGGLFRSPNHGVTWECIFQDEASVSIGAIALDPENPEVIWVGTGEANNQRSSYWGDGVYKSTDGGESWTNVGLRDSQHIGRIAVNPKNTDQVFVAAAGALYSSNEERGLYRTDDGGQSWTKVIDLGPDVGVIDVVLDAFDPNLVYAASYERRRRAWNFDGAGPGSAIYRSEDGGRSFQKVEGGLPSGEIGRIGLDVSRQRAGVVYATVSNQNPRPAEPVEEDDTPPRLGVSASDSDDGLAVTAVTEDSPAAQAGVQVGDVVLRSGETELATRAALRVFLGEQERGDRFELVVRRDGEEQTLEVRLGEARSGRARRGGGSIGGEIYCSEDAGRSWEKRNGDRAIGGSPAYYYGQIIVDPSDDQTIYILSVPLLVSRDGGKTWNDGNLASSVHVDHHALWVDPRDSDHLILGNDGGLYLSYDRGEHWVHVDNLPLAQFYAVGVDDAMPYNIAGGTQDNGTWMGPSRTRNARGASNVDWQNIGGGDGFYAVFDAERADVVYVESQFGAIQRRDLLTGAGRSIRPPRDREGESDRYNWMSPIVTSPHSAGTVYFGGNRLFKSYDRGGRWHAISPDLTTQNAEKIAGNVPHCTITTIDESPLVPERLLVGTDDGNVQWSDDGGDHWINCAGLFPGLPPRRWVSRVEFSHHDADTAFVSFTGYREDDRANYLYRTQDAGVTWVSVAGDLPEGGINVVREDPDNAALWYVGTEFGAFASLDEGAHWVELSAGLPTQPVHDLVIQSRARELVAATHGRGFFVLDIAGLQDLSAERLGAAAHLCRPQSAVLWRRTSTQAGGFSGDGRWRAENPAAGADLYVYLKEDVEADSLKLRVEGPRGDTLRELEVPATRGLHLVRWDLSAASEEGQGNRRRRPTRVGPGSYRVVLEIGEEVQSHDLEVVDDPS